MRLLPLLLAFACVPGDDEDPVEDTESVEDRVAALAGRGPHRVGYTEETVAYDDMVAGGTRSLRLGLWYPTSDTSGPVATFTGPRRPADVRRDATPEARRFPLVVFSHGHQGSHDNCAALLAWFASHGFVAAAPEHTGNTLANGDHRTVHIYVQRPFDVSAVLDHLFDGSWSERLDGRVLAVGHSFGGYTVLPLVGAGWDVDRWSTDCAAGASGSFCDGWSASIEEVMRGGASDPRVLAAVSLSGGNFAQFGGTGLAGVDRPVMIVSGDLEPGEDWDRIWEALPDGPHVRATLAHGDHQTYTDFAQLGGGLLPGTSPDALDWERGHRITQVLLGAFADAHLAGSDLLAPVLDGRFVVDEDVTVTAR